MLPEGELRNVLSSLPSATIYGPWSRAVRAHHLLQPPGPPQPLWPYGSMQNGARYTPQGGFPSIYLASDLQTAYVEVEAVITVAGTPPRFARHAPLVFVAVEGLLANVLDLTEAEIQTTLGTSLQELTGNWQPLRPTGQLSPTQVLGQAAHDSGRFVGLRAASSKNPAGQIIALFYDHLAAGQGSMIEVHDPEGHFRQRLP